MDHERKLIRRFELMDTDGDGYLERDDYEALAHRLIQEFAERPDSAKGRAVLDTYLRYWDEFVGQMDTDGDGRVTKEEFVASIGTKTVDADEFARVAAPHFRAVCELADTNNDGSLDRTEYVRLASIYGVNRQDAEAAFEQIDSNHDDTLTVEELITAGWDFYLSEDDTSTGSALFGPH